MATSQRVSGLLLGLLIAGGLAGCHRSSKSEYWLDIRNNTGGMVTVDVVLDDGSHYKPISEAKHIPPNSRTTMGPVKAKESAQPQLQAQTPDDSSYPARFPLSPGLSVVNITREEPKGKLELKLAPRN